MKLALALSRNLDPRRAFILRAAAVGLLLPAVFAQNAIAYLCIAGPVVVPLFLWLRAGAAGMPILPVISGLYFIYYAVPMLRGELTFYGSESLVEAGATVGAFLLAASLASWPFLSRARARRTSARNFVPDRQIVRLVFIGLTAGIIYYLALMSGSLNWLGPSISLVRSLALTLTSLACYFLGCARTSRLLVGGQWVAALAGMILLVILSLSNLLLVGGIMNLLAAFLGYIITGKRVPWFSMAMICAILAVLHAGKLQMRSTYWLPNSQFLEQSSAVELPAMMVDWFTGGVDALWSGGNESDLLERATLLHMLLLVQRTTPDLVPYLGGDTYALLPSMLVPRFVEPDKPQSQAGLNLLSIRYGLQTLESTANTTIGWGVVAEAYANFGYIAVVIVGVFFGALCGALMRISAAAAPLSVPMLVTIAAALVLFNLELDLSYLIITLFQTVVSTVVFASLPKLWTSRRRRAIPAEAMLLNGEFRPHEASSNSPPNG
ncbi:MAG: hypothetical protein QOD40_3090 [Alphaproteobacteria bacterium]|jgi:hypothetical protein|nr:hypothetical protein [Alphaproteobacteria bacterium]